jgi:hypothetical protein
MSAATLDFKLEMLHEDGTACLDASTTTPTLEANGQHEHEVLEKLVGITPPGSSTSIIAVDLDDVLCQTNVAVAECKSHEFVVSKPKLNEVCNRAQ